MFNPFRQIHPVPLLGSVNSRNAVSGDVASEGRILFSPKIEYRDPTDRAVGHYPLGRCRGGTRKRGPGGAKTGCFQVPRKPPKKARKRPKINPVASGGDINN